jgi:hypothetical protein
MISGSKVLDDWVLFGIIPIKFLKMGMGPHYLITLGKHSGINICPLLLLIGQPYPSLTAE